MSDTSRFLQIREEDLAELERACPVLCDRVALHPDGCDVVMLRRIEAVKRVLSDVRWDYGPHTNVEKIDPDQIR